LASGKKMSHPTRETINVASEQAGKQRAAGPF
jgi:hypothetical protein